MSLNNVSKHEYKVLVNTITYNQSKYIKDTLDGIAKQQTNFPFVSCVLEDCSTDGEQDVIKEWVDKNCDKESIECKDIPTANVIIARHKVNKNCTFAIYLFKENLWKKPDVKYAHIILWREKCTYEALCEGDDYWTDPLKLQKQVDFMDANPDYVMCFHNAMERWEDEGGREQPFSNIENRDYVGVEMYRHWIVPTASVLFRHNEVYPSKIYKTATSSTKFIFGDIILFLSAASLGKVRGMSDCMSVYRRTENGIVIQLRKSYEKQFKMIEHNLEIFHVFGNEYKKDSEFLFHYQCLIISRDAKKAGNTGIAKMFKDKSMKYSYWGYYKTYFTIIILDILDYMKSRWHIDIYKLRRIIKKMISNK